MTQPPRRSLLKLAGLMLFLAGSTVNAADFPSKPIRLIAPFAAGGSTDLLARIIAPEINAVLGEVMALPDVRSRLNQIGVEPTMTSPAEFSQFIKSGIPKWARVIQVSGSKTKR